MMANALTGFRLLCALGLLFCPMGSAAFYALYLLAGLSDMLDGTVARKMHTASDFGAKFDTAADFAFFAAVLGKLAIHLTIPIWLWIWTGAIFLLKIATLMTGLVRKRQLVVQHTVLNKITGLALFLLPLTLPWIELRYSAVLVCLLATAGAVQEGYLTGKK